MDGLLLLTLGLFMKVVVADSMLAATADTVFSNPGLMPAVDAWTGVLAFSGQIFFRFCGLFHLRRRRSAVPGFCIAAKFQLPLRCRGVHRFLAPLAYYVIYLAEGLPVHSPRWQQEGGYQDVHCINGNHAVGRTLAWRQLDVCGLGWITWPVFMDRTVF